MGMRTTKFALATALVAVALMAASNAAVAQCPSLGLPIGTTLTCIALATKTITPVPVVKDPKLPNDQRNDNLLDGNQEAAIPAQTFTSNGTGTFSVTSTGIGTPCSVNLTPAAISLTGSNATLGTITTSLSATGAPTTTITSNQANTEFPATGNVYFNVSVTISSQPGKTFTSRTAIQLQNTNLNSFNPHVNETYSQVGTVTLNDASGAGAYTISGLSVTLN